MILKRKQDLTAQQRAERIVERILHDAHLRYQKLKLQAEDTTLVRGGHLTSPEVRGCKREAGNSERKAHVFKPEWFTMLRPNFWKAYFDTMSRMSR